MPEGYIELHARSAFSFLEGASLPETLAAECAELGSPAMALLDRNGVYGSPRFHLAAKKLGIQAHIGAEVAISLEDDDATAPSPDSTHTASLRIDRPGPVYLPLLARTRDGYRNLCSLITLIKLRAPKETFGSKPRPAATLDELADHSDGLVCLTGGADGPLASLLKAGAPDISKATRFTGRLIDIFGKENVYAELQRHFDREEESRNQVVVQIARLLGLPLLAANGVCYATAAERQIADVLTCVRNRVTLETAGRLLAKNSERHLKPGAVMSALFADMPDAIANTRELSSRLEFTLSDLGYEFPKYPVPPGGTMNGFLRKRTEEGARRRYRPFHNRARQQIERELALIEKLDLAGYFLIVWDIVNFCRDHDILVQGRGSAANSAVCYSLGITAVDPVGMELLFERFLSEERGEWPDIDLDLPSGDQREQAIQYVYERYGRLGAAMTANVITYRGRSAARDIGKVLGFDPSTLGRLSSLAGAWEWKDPDYTVDRQFRDAGLDVENGRILQFLQLYSAVQDLPRHLGQHSGGLVICQGQLNSVVPLEPATMPGRVVVQWDKDDCADMGIIKVDLLGLGMMAVLEDSLELIRDSYGEEVDLAHLPPDDPAVYEALQNADTIAMFQIESRAQMSSLPRLKPKCFYDIVVQVAIIRPGPIVGNMVHPYMKRRQGKEEPDYMHPALEPVLKRTLGVPLFQEQLLRMAMICAGFSGGEAEELRRAFGFKRSEMRMREVEVKLRAGMDRNGITGEAQEAIIKSITSFALYGFPESHAASFALLAYASAYMKCHYLAAFTAATLNNQPMGFYHPFTIVKDAQRHGLHFKPVDITRSAWSCTLEPEEPSRDQVESDKSEERNQPRLAVRLGLRCAKGLREEAAHAVIRERQKRPFTSVDDLSRRVPELRKDEIRKLAQIGALNFVEPSNQLHRRDALWQVERASRHAGPLLEETDEFGTDSPLARMSLEERMNADLSGTGLTIGRHPMACHRSEMNKLGALRAIDLRKVPDGRRVRIAGSVIVRQRPGTAKGFIFLSMEDETGIMNAIITPDVFEHNRIVLVSEPYLLIDGVLQNQDGVIHVKAQRIQPLNLGAVAPSSHDFH